MRREDVLIINDGTPFLKTIAQVLESKGYCTLVADNPEDGLEELARGRFSLVIIKLKGRTAAYLTAMSLVEELLPETKLIILGEGAPLPVEAYEIKADDYIHLPCRPLEVWRRIRNCLQASGQARAPAALLDKAHAINGRVLKRLDLLFHDLTEGLAAIRSALKQLERRTQKNPGPDAGTPLKEAQRKAGQLEALLEQFLKRTMFSVVHSQTSSPQDLGEELSAPMFEEL